MQSTGANKKAACFGIDGLGSFDESKLQCYDVRNVPLFVPF